MPRWRCIVSDFTLADGCPVWEGQAVLFGSGSPRGRYYIRRLTPTGVEVDHGHTVDSGSLVADLSHRPTFLDLATRTLTAIHTKERPPASFNVVGMFGTDVVLDVQPVVVVFGIRFGYYPTHEVITIPFYTPAALLALWLEVSLG